MVSRPAAVGQQAAAAWVAGVSATAFGCAELTGPGASDWGFVFLFFSRWCVSMHWEIRRRFEGVMRASPALPLRRRFTRAGDVDLWVARLEQEVAARRKAA